MPTILREKGYRVSFFMADGGEPAHVHVSKENRGAKFWMSPVRLARNFGLAPHELREAAELLVGNESAILAAWNECFGS